MRTVKREVSLLNSAKKKLLENSCFAYAHEKNHWLDVLRAKKYQALLGSHRHIRDEAVKNGYQSKYGLQARQWKLALQDAAETWDKYYQALFVQVREKISRHLLSDLERQYAYWLLKGYSQFIACMSGKAPEPSFLLDAHLRSKIANYVERTARKLQGNSPRVKKLHSAKFDADCYEVFEENGVQYIKLMSLQKGKRIVLPLLGRSKIERTLTLIIKNDKVKIHVSEELQPCTLINEGSLEAVDAGYTEVMTDTEGVRSGKNLGPILTKASDEQNKKMIQRHKLHSFEKIQRKKIPQKAKHIRKYNLGRQKLNDTMEKVRSSISKEINTAINQLIRSKKPSILITEDLRSPFTYNKSKTWNRRLSSWVRGEIQDRISFKALTECFRHEQVHPAYGSQVCFLCGFVDNRNRKGDEFRCLHCKHEDVADRVAAVNYARRYGDEEIRRHMPCRQVKTILLERFFRRLETGQPVTVPGKTLETVEERIHRILSKTMFYSR